MGFDKESLFAREAKIEKYRDMKVREVLAGYDSLRSVHKVVPRNDIKNLLQSCQEGSLIEFVSDVIRQLPSKEATTPILECLASMWGEPDRNALVHKLAKEGFMPGTGKSVFYFLASLQIDNPHKAVMILNFGNTKEANAYL
jgi:hypothetical protein